MPTNDAKAATHIDQALIRRKFGNISEIMVGNLR